MSLVTGAAFSFGSLLSLPRFMREPLLLVNDEAHELFVSDPRWGSIGGHIKKMAAREGLNQDSAGLFPTARGIVLAVADGVGGGPDGEHASRIAIEQLALALQSPDSEVRGSVLDAFERANQLIMARGTGAATTLSVVELEADAGRLRFRTYHAGDSGSWVCGGRGRIKMSTVNHSPVGYAVEAGLLPADEALHHSDLNLVSNLVGMSAMRIDMGVPRQLSPRDTIVVGSDGLFDNVHLNEIVELVRKGPLSVATTRLGELAASRMQSPQGEAPSKPDDIAFFVFRGAPTKETAVKKSGRPGA